jgi:hypothetical protein
MRVQFKSLLLCALGALWLIDAAGNQVAAQEPGPPKIISVFVEEIKPGRTAAHQRVEAGYPRAFKDAKASPYIAMTSISGRSEAWFLVGFDSYEAMEKENQHIEKNAKLSAALARLDEQDAPFRANQRAMILRYREDLSYQPGVNLAEMRYFQVITFRVRPGHVRSFVEARRMSKSHHEQAKVDEHYAIFQADSGLPAGTFMMFIPRKSLKELDTDPHTKEYQDAVGDEGRKKLDKMSSEDVLVVETSIFAFSPSMSYPSEALLKGDPAFWKPKPQPRAVVIKKPQGTTSPSTNQ